MNAINYYSDIEIQEIMLKLDGMNWGGEGKK